jgi:hypothetical protein
MQILRRLQWRRNHNALDEANMYVKSVRGWSCAEDAATTC